LSFQSASQMLSEQLVGLEGDEGSEPGSEAETPPLEIALEPVQLQEQDEQSPKPPHRPLQFFSLEELHEPGQLGSEAA